MSYQKQRNPGDTSAYSGRKPGAPGYQTLSRQLEAGSLPRVILLYGAEEYLIRWMISQITARYVPEETRFFNLTTFDGYRYDDARSVIEACEMLPMLSEKKVVLLEHFRKTGGQNPNQAAIDELAGYLANVPDTTLLIVTMSEAEDAGGAFLDSAQKAGQAYQFDRLDRTMLAGFTKKYLKQAGAVFNNDTIAAIIELSGYFDRESDYTLNDLRSDIDKLALYSDGPITREDVETIVLGNEETDGFAFTDALSAGDKQEALRILSSMLSHGSNEFNILGLICSQFEVMMLIQETRENGRNPSFLESELRLNKYRIRRLSGPASRFTAVQLKRGLLKAYEIDRNVKTGVMDARLGLELFIAAV